MHHAYSNFRERMCVGVRERGAFPASGVTVVLGIVFDLTAATVLHGC